MASKNAEFIAVRKSDLEKLPKGVQKWVLTFFRETTIANEPWYAAFTDSSLVHYHRNPGGVALVRLGPGEYTEGLPKGMSLVEWVRQSRKKGIFRFDVSWNDGNIEPVDDGD